MKMATIKVTGEELITLLDAIADANEALRDAIIAVENDSLSTDDDRERLDYMRNKLTRNEKLYDAIGDQRG